MITQQQLDAIGAKIVQYPNGVTLLYIPGNTQAGFTDQFHQITDPASLQGLTITPISSLPGVQTGNVTQDFTYGKQFGNVLSSSSIDGLVNTYTTQAAQGQALADKLAASNTALGGNIFGGNGQPIRDLSVATATTPPANLTDAQIAAKNAAADAANAQYSGVQGGATGTTGLTDAQIAAKNAAADAANAGYGGVQGGTNTSGTGTGTGTGGTGAGGINFTPTGNPQYDALLSQMQGFLNKLVANGQKINPNVQITPEQLAQFTAQAAAQIHPYYASQLTAATSQFLGSLGYNLQSYKDQVAKAQTDYGRQLDTLASNSADQGFAQSGVRQKQEGQLATDTQYSLDTARNALTNASTNSAATFANTYGGTNVPTAPTIGSAPRVLPGQANFSTNNSNSGLYTLDPNIYNQLIGSNQNSEKSATDTLAAQLGSNYVQQQSNNTTRSLNTT